MCFINRASENSTTILRNQGNFGEFQALYQTKRRSQAVRQILRLYLSMELPEPQQQRILVYVSMSGMTQLNPEIQAVCMTDPSLEQVLSSFRRLKGISRLHC